MAGSSPNPSSPTGTKLWLVESALTDVIVSKHNIGEHIVRADTEEAARELFMDENPDDNIILCRPLTLEDINKAMRDDVTELYL